MSTTTDMHNTTDAGMIAAPIQSRSDDSSRPRLMDNGPSSSAYHEGGSDTKPATKINISTIPLLGRGKELQALHDGYNRMLARGSALLQPDAPTIHGHSTDSVPSSVPVIFVRGASGTGKTKMIDQFATNLHQEATADNHAMTPSHKGGIDGNSERPKKISSKTRGNARGDSSSSSFRSAQAEGMAGSPLPYFIRGKTDEHIQDSDPFSAIVQALNDFFRQVGATSNEEQERIRKRIRQHLGSQATVVGKLVPAIRPFLMSKFSKNGTSIADHTPRDEANQHQSLRSGSVQSITSKQMNRLVGQIEAKADVVWNQLRYTFTTLLHAISTKKRPVILFLDDLQWSSQVSIDLISMLLSDSHLKYFMLIGAIRQDTNPHSPADLLELGAEVPLRRMMDSFRAPTGLTDHSGALKTPDARASITSNASTPKKPKSMDWTELVLSHHTHQEVAECLSFLLNRSIEDLEPFTSKIYNRSQGNMFFTLRLLEQMQDANILTFSHAASRWEWHWPERNDSDSRSIGDDSHSLPMAHDIVELMTQKLNQLSPALQAALSSAAYIRSTFDLTTLQMVLNAQPMVVALVLTNHKTAVIGDGNGSNTAMSHADSTISEQILSELLEDAVLEGLLTNFTGGCTYSFAHDRIQQAAYESVPIGEDRSKLRTRIGTCLYKHFRSNLESSIEDDDDCDSHQDGDAHDENSVATRMTNGNIVDETLLFVAADHLNSVPTKDHLSIAKLNLHAGDLALSMAALVQASVYYQSAHTAMKKVRDAWKSHYKLNIKLYTARAKIEFALGRFESGNELSQVVLNHAKTLNEKLPTYASMIQALGAQDKQHESLRLGRKVTQLLKSYPRGSYGLHIFRKMLMVRKYVKKTTDKQIMSQPVVSDSNDILPLVFLREMLVRSFISQTIVHFMLATLTILLRSRKVGLTEDVGLAYACYGFFVGKMGDEKGALRFGRLSMTIMDKTGSQSIRGFAHILRALFIHPWSEPAGPLVNAYIPIYMSSMEHGAFSDALSYWQTCNFLALTEGYPLGDVHRSSEDLIDQMHLYNVSSTTGYLNQGMKFSSILLGHNPIDWEAIREFGGSGDIKSMETLDVRVAYAMLLHLCVLFRRYDIAETIIARHKQTMESDSSYARTVQRLLCTGLTAAGLYRQTGRKKYLQQVRDARRVMRTLCNKKGQSSLNRSLLLRAELDALTTTVTSKEHIKRVKQTYEDAILSSIECGHVHDAALACELAGEYMLTKASFCRERVIVELFSRSYEYYSQWGATLKLDHLKRRRGEYINEQLYSAGQEGKQGKATVIMSPGFGTIRNTVTGRVLPTFDYRNEYSLIYANQQSVGSVVGAASPGEAKDAMTRGGDTCASPTGTKFGSEEEDDEVSVLTDGSNSL